MPGPTWIVSPLLAAATAGPIWRYWQPLGHTVSVAADAAPAPAHSSVITMGTSSTTILALRHTRSCLIASPLRSNTADRETRRRVVDHHQAVGPVICISTPRALQEADMTPTWLPGMAVGASRMCRIRACQHFVSPWPDTSGGHMGCLGTGHVRGVAGPPATSL